MTAHELQASNGSPGQTGGAQITEEPTKYLQKMEPLEPSVSASTPAHVPWQLRRWHELEVRIRESVLRHTCSIWALNEAIAVCSGSAGQMRGCSGSTMRTRGHVIQIGRGPRAAPNRHCAELKAQAEVGIARIHRDGAVASKRSTVRAHRHCACHCKVVRDCSRPGLKPHRAMDQRCGTAAPPHHW